MSADQPPRLWYTPQELAILTGFTASFIRAELRAGSLLGHYIKPHGRQRGRWMIHTDNAHAYLVRLGYSSSPRST